MKKVGRMQQEEIKRLYEKHHGRMLFLAKQMLADDEESHDVVSDVFAQLAEQPPTMTHPTSYLLNAVRNRCLNLLRKKRLAERVHRLLPIGEETSYDDNIPTNYPLEEMLRFVETQLTPQTRNVVKLRFNERKTYREIAMALNISEAAVYKHLAQAISKLKRRFNP